MISMLIMMMLLGFNIMFFSSSSLTKKTVSFLFMVVISLFILPSWASVLLLLLYIGGLFIVLTYIITFSFFQEKFFFLGLMVSLGIIFMLPFLSSLESNMSFYLFGSLMTPNWFIYPLFLLLVGLLLVSMSSPASKSIRGGF